MTELRTVKIVYVSRRESKRYCGEKITRVEIRTGNASMKSDVEEVLRVVIEDGKPIRLRLLEN